MNNLKLIKKAITNVKRINQRIESMKQATPMNEDLAFCIGQMSILAENLEDNLEELCACENCSE